MADNDEKDPQTSSTDDDDDDDDEDSTSSSTSSSSEDEQQAEEDSDDELTTLGNKLTPKQVYVFYENKRKALGKRLLELRNELKAQPQADIDVKKRLLTEIKNLREKWIAVQTRLTNLKARLSHSPTPERSIAPKTTKSVQPTPTKQVQQKEAAEKVKVEERVIPPPRVRTSSYSSSSRSRSSSRESERSHEKPYEDLDALEERNDHRDTEPKNSVSQPISIRPTTSYRDLTEDLRLSPTPSPPSQSNLFQSTSFSNLDQLTLTEPAAVENDDEEEDSPHPTPKETFINQKIPYPIVNDKRDLEVINRQLKNQFREFEASRNNPLYDQQANLMIFERLKKQNDFINIRMRIERLKKIKAKTQREREQNKKQFHHLLQEFRKLQRSMRSANRQAWHNQSTLMDDESLLSSIPLPSSPPPVAPASATDDLQLPPLDLHKVTGKKILFESSDEDEIEDQSKTEPQVPVSLSISEPRTVPDPINIPLPLPSNSTLLPKHDALISRVTNLINSTTQTTVTPEEGEEEEREDGEDHPASGNEFEKTMLPKSNRKRRKTKRNKRKKKSNQNSTSQEAMNENDPTGLDQAEVWRRYIAMQLQYRFLKASNPVLQALTAEAQKKLGVNQDEIADIPFDEDMMDYETALILQQQQQFLAAAEANPFHILHNAAAGSSSSRPNLVDVLSNLNGGILSSEPQTPMSLLQKFFFDANKNSNNDNRSGNELSTTPPTPPTPRDISIGKKIVESLTHQDINALLKLSGSEHDDDSEDNDEENDENNPLLLDETDSEINQFSFDEDSNDAPNGTNNNYERWERPTPIPSRPNQSSNSNNKKSAVETLILPSFNRCTHLGKSNKRSNGLERMFPSFSKHNTGPSSTLSLILYGLSSTP